MEKGKINGSYDERRPKKKKEKCRAQLKLREKMNDYDVSLNESSKNWNFIFCYVSKRLSIIDDDEGKFW